MLVSAVGSEVASHTCKDPEGPIIMLLMSRLRVVLSHALTFGKGDFKMYHKILMLPTDFRYRVGEVLVTNLKNGSFTRMLWYRTVPRSCYKI